MLPLYQNSRVSVQLFFMNKPKHNLTSRLSKYLGKKSNVTSLAFVLSKKKNKYCLKKNWLYYLSLGVAFVSNALLHL